MTIYVRVNVEMSRLLRRLHEHAKHNQLLHFIVFNTSADLDPSTTTYTFTVHKHYLFNPTLPRKRHITSPTIKEKPPTKRKIKADPPPKKMASSYRNLTTPNFTLTLPAPYIAQIEVNRPAKLNAYTTEMFFTLGNIFHTLSRDPDVRVIILTAKGDKAFTAGLDVSVAAKEGPLSLVFGEGGKGEGDGGKGDGDGGKDVAGKDVARKAWELRRHIKEIQKPVSEIEGCEKPVICVVSYSFSFFSYYLTNIHEFMNNNTKKN